MITPGDPLRARLLDDQSRCRGLLTTRRGVVTCVRRFTCLRHVAITDDAARPAAARQFLSTFDYACAPGADAFLSLMKD